MKYALTILVVMVFGLTGCSSQKKLVKEAPFSVENPSCTPYAGGREGSGSGFILRIPLTLLSDEEITFEKVFFRGHILDPEWVAEGGKRFLQCQYQRKSTEKPDIIMHGDPMMEVGNQPAGEITEKEEYPFELKPDEAVIAYLQKGKTRYAKIGSIKDKMPNLLPSKEMN
ncbi:hypothetical protein [Lentiprolixibacter aurantiacus]|uniref:Lipoprotein n=1 Tax=Lentiprolixibacter aurantiacus TaxID=2993939 RepID=A0AAE3SNK8_9FLAO|nr:hypothetical protein [Lentiprolixibacter aurantiacus]MCX2718577.1 hypothetical protein [Lentiprolixibacter aurantiacus]